MTNDRTSAPPGEAERLAALRSYDVLDTPAEAVFDDITQLAAHSCDMPIALISLIDETRQWFKSKVGLDVAETPREVAFCEYAIEDDEILEVADARKDPRFCDNPLVTGAPGIRFYAGAPLHTSEGHNLGTVCVIDRKPGKLSPAQRASLVSLARQVVLQLELRRALAESEQARNAANAAARRSHELEQTQRKAEQFMRATIDALQDNIAIVDNSGTIIDVNHAWTEFARANAAPVLLAGLGVGANYLEVCERAANSGDAAARQVATGLRKALNGETPAGFSMEYPCHAPGEKRWFIVRISVIEGSADVCVVIAHQNITQRIQAERTTLHLNRELETRVQARTAELEHTYATLSTSEEKFRTLFENAAIGIVLIDLDGRIGQANRAYGEITRRDAAQLTGMPLKEIAHPDDFDRMAALRSKIAAGEIPGFETEVRYLSPQGEAQWTHVSSSAVRNAAGEVQQIMAVVQNIEQRKQAEYERDRFFELSMDMLVIAGTDATWHRWNPACTRILGYSDAELSVLTPVDLVHPDEQQRVLDIVARLAEGKSLPLLDVRMRNKQGEYRNIRWSAAFWKGENLLILVGRDVTSFYAMERVLHEREAVLVQAEHMAHLGSWSFKTLHNKIHCSPALLAIAGRAGTQTPAEISELIDFVAPNDQRSARTAIEDALSKGRSSEMRCQIRRPDGTEREVQSYIAPLRSPDGQIYGVSGACLDVTEFRQTEARALKSEGRFRALAVRLQNIREEERTAISREIHDELGQMLTALKMDLTLLHRDASKSGRPLGRKHVAQELMGMEKLVDATLEAVRRIARQLRPELLDALGLVPAIEWHAAELSARAGFRCVVYGPERLPDLSPEIATAFFRIAQEALTNIVRHADAEHVQLTLEHIGDELLLSVIDDGRGFDGEPVGGGSLGLLGMRERAMVVGGAIEIQSHAGTGTMITVRAPLYAPTTGGLVQ